MPLAFRFDAQNHEYLDIDTGELVPHITGMLERTGWIDDRWYTEESSLRGTAVHRLAADYDLKALDLASCQSLFRGYLLAHVKAVTTMQPQMVAVEEPLVHSKFKFGGRPDRLCIVLNQKGVWEIKSGDPEKSHQIQTALQAILAGEEFGLPPESLARYCCYVKDKGKFKVKPHDKRADFDEAYRIIRECTR